MAAEINTQLLAEAYGRFYEQLKADTPRSEYTLFFDNNSEFSDPFQTVKGIQAIEHVFLDMYATLHNPYFVIDEIVTNEKVAYLRWHFHFCMKEGAFKESFTGVSRVTFSKSAKVISHIDYWDAGHNVYEKIPILGSLIRYVKKKIKS